jgi:hypothetical protein
MEGECRMSLKTWKKEFYPVEADEGIDEKTWEQCLDESLLKWQGILPENVEKHELNTRHHVVYEGESAFGPKAFRFSGTTCALCAKDQTTDTQLCKGCPLYKSRGDVACDHETNDEEDSGEESPYHHTNPKKMIEALEEAKEYLNDNH